MSDYTSKYEIPWSQYQRLPSFQQLYDYVENHVPVGNFLLALLSNNLSETFGRADHLNVMMIGGYVEFLYNYVPTTCWGNIEKVNTWIALGRAKVYDDPNHEIVKVSSTPKTLKPENAVWKARNIETGEVAYRVDPSKPEIVEFGDMSKEDALAFGRLALNANVPQPTVNGAESQAG